MNIIVKLLLIIIAATGGWFGYQQYKTMLCDDDNGMRCRNIQVKELKKWERDANLMAEITDNQLMLQEDVSGNGGYLRNTNKIPGDFIFKFDFKSWSEVATINIQMQDLRGRNIMDVSIHQSPSQTLVRLYRGDTLLGTTILTALNPDLFYEFKMEKIGDNVNVYFDGGVVLQAVDTSNTPESVLMLTIKGQPYKPAGIALRHMRIYQ